MFIIIVIIVIIIIIIIIVIMSLSCLDSFASRSTPRPMWVAELSPQAHVGGRIWPPRPMWVVPYVLSGVKLALALSPARVRDHHCYHYIIHICCVIHIHRWYYSFYVICKYQTYYINTHTIMYVLS